MKFKIPVDWKEIRLGDVLKYRTERIETNKIGLDNYISTENLLPNFSGKRRANNLPKSKTVNFYQIDDILVSNIRPYFEKIWKADGTGGASSDVLVFENINTRNDSNFLYYRIANTMFFDYVMSGAKGTKMPRGDKKHILEFIMGLPTKAEQKSIADTLSALDNKIENNNKINRNLEEQAKALFKNWFVDFEFPNAEGLPYKSSGGEMIESEIDLIPKGWTKSKVGNILKVELGGTPARKKPEYWNGNINWINSGELNADRIINATEMITELGVQKSSTKLWPKHTTVIAITGATLGQTSLLLINTCANQSVIGIKESEEIPYTYIYPFILNVIPELKGHQTGGAQQHINKGNVESVNILIPDEKIMENYDNLIRKHYEIIENNLFENQKLVELRDTLLPKLMSGELRIPLDREGV